MRECSIFVLDGIQKDATTVCVHACLCVFIHACVCVFAVHLQIVSLAPHPNR